MKGFKNQKGISLIVLVITIIVMIILAAAIILALNSNMVLGKANKAVIKSNLVSLQEKVTIYFSNNYGDIDTNKEYTITEFEITESEFEEYRDITIITGGKLYVKPNASEDIKEVATELDILINGVSSNVGSVTLQETAKSLKIYGNSVKNSETNDITNVGDNTKNLFNMNLILQEQGWVKQEDGSYYVQNANSVNEKVLWENTDGYTGQIKILCKRKFAFSMADAGSLGVTINVVYSDGTLGQTYFTDQNLAEANTWYDMNWLSDSKKTISKIKYSYGTGKNSTWIKDIMITKDLSITEYDTYGYKVPITMTYKNGETKTYNIYLSEPLRKLGDITDYLNVFTGEVVRYIGVKDIASAESIEESYEILNDPVTETVDVSEIEFSEVNNISVNTSVVPSNIEVRY